MSFENCPAVLCLTVSFLCCISCSIFTNILFTMSVLTFVRHFVMLSGMAFMQPRLSDGIYPTVRIRPVKKTSNSIISTVSNTSICSTVGISSTSVGLVILLRNPKRQSTAVTQLSRGNSCWSWDVGLFHTLFSIISESVRDSSVSGRFTP